MVNRELRGLESAVADLQTALNRADRAMAHEFDVGGAEDLQVLRLLLAEGPKRVSDLARLRSTSVATTSARLDRLEKRGLVLRTRTAADRRAVIAELTPDGRRVAVASQRRRLTELAPLAIGFPIHDLRRLIDAIGLAEASSATPT